LFRKLSTILRVMHNVGIVCPQLQQYSQQHIRLLANRLLNKASTASQICMHVLIGH
jgi:hypothetical protein